MVKEKFIIDSDTNCLILAWPSIYRKKIFWRDLIKIYYKLISIIISNGYHIILIHHENVNIENEIEFIGKKFSDINSNYKSNISFHEYDFDDIWIRDYGPKLTKSGIARLIFNGYGEKYFHKNDSLFFNYLMQKYPRNNNDMFNNIVIEGGNIINSSKDCILNINPIIMHNQLSSNSIKNKTKELFEQYMDGDYHLIDIQELTGDDTDGHIDNIVRFKNDTTLLYMSTNEKDHPDYEILKNLEKQLGKLIKNSNNINDMIPIDHNYQDVVRNRNGSILPFSYLNFIMIGDLIIFPVNLNTDIQKKKYLEELFPDKNIYFIESSALLNEFGSLHCCSNNFVI